VTPPERFKQPADLSIDEILEHRRTGELPETDAYRQARRDALERAGLERDDPAPKDLAAMTPADHAQHFNRIRSNDR
jgi:hypothetical protein